jgi:quercetin dioxygenase-like cupin family protein
VSDRSTPPATGGEPRRSAFGSFDGRVPLDLFPGATLHSLGGDQVLLCRVRYEPGTHVPRHHHEHTEQVMLVISGRLTLQVGDERREMTEGDAAVVNRGVEHELWSAAGATFIEALAPVPLDHVGDPAADLVLGPDRGAGHVAR